MNSHKEKLQKEAHEKHQNLSEDEKEKSQKRLKTDRKIFLKKKKKKKRQYHPDRNKNLSEGEKQKNIEYMRNYYLAH